MKRAQIYILLAVIVASSIAGLANIMFSTSVDVQREQVSLAGTKAIINNIQNEIVYTISIDPSYLSDFMNFSKQYATEKNVNLTVS